MKIEQVADNKIEVTVTAKDLKNLDTELSSLKPDSPELQTFLFKIMEKVRNETGFNPSNGQIVVEASPSHEGIRLTITKLTKTMPTAKEIKKLFLKQSKPVIKRVIAKRNIYCFDSFNNLKDALLYVDIFSLRNGCLYQFRDTYYLAINAFDNFALANSVFMEFCDGELDTNKYTETFLAEHGLIIADNDKLITLSAGIKEYEL